MKLTRPAVLLGAVPALALALAPSAALAGHGQHRGHDVIRADLTPSLPTDDPINLVAPGGAPWQIDRGEVRVRPNGRMDVRIEGLKVTRPDGTADNPVPMIDAVLYCGGRLTADSGPQQLSVPGGGGLTVTVRNQGRLGHTFRIRGREKNVLSFTTVRPGEQRSRSFNLGPGTYTMYCALANHEELGMYGKLTVR
jgi:hypothetical protein